MDMLVKSDNLAITGEGTTELLDTRLNTNVTANTLLTLRQLYVNIKGLVIPGYNKGQRFNIWNLRR